MLDGLNLQIEQAAAECGSYIEAIVNFAAENELDVEDIAEGLHPIIKEKLKTEFISKNFFPDKKIDNPLTDFFKDE